MEVREAGGDDLLAIGRVTHKAWWTAYSGLIHGSTISAVLESWYTPSSLAQRIASNPFFLAIEHDQVVGWAEAILEDDRVVLTALYSDPDARRVGAATALLEKVRSLAPDLPVCADVLLGNLDGEGFYESQGFVPGEIVPADLFGEAIVQRRWWLAPAIGGGVASLPSHG